MDSSARRDWVCARVCVCVRVHVTDRVSLIELSHFLSGSRLTHREHAHAALRQRGANNGRGNN